MLLVSIAQHQELFQTLLENKICPKCELKKEFSFFRRNKKRVDGLSRVCKSCDREYDKHTIEKRKIKNKNVQIDASRNQKCTNCKIEKSFKEFYRNISTKNGVSKECKLCDNERSKSTNRRYKSYLYFAKKRNLIFQISIKEFKDMVNKNCYYCKEGLGGIDRINSNEGYILANCVPCCIICNRMKSDMNKDKFLEHIRKILGEM